jgi:HD-like signal output (HDOD) protein
MQILEKSEDLPCLPMTAIKVFKLCSEDNVDQQKLEELLRSDQALIAKILRTVNSALYGIRREITSIREAISLLGIQGIKNVVLQSSTADLFNFEGGKQLWHDSIEASIIIEALAKQLKQSSNDTQFLTALLHNIGRSIFAKHFSKIYTPIISECHKLSEIYLAEEALFAMDNRETGGILACNWELPLDVVSGIQGNHSSMAENNLIDLALTLTYCSLDEILEKAELKQFANIKEESLEKIKSLTTA